MTMARLTSRPDKLALQLLDGYGLGAGSVISPWSAMMLEEGRIFPLPFLPSLSDINRCYALYIATEAVRVVQSVGLYPDFMVFLKGRFLGLVFFWHT